MGVQRGQMMMRREVETTRGEGRPSVRQAVFGVLGAMALLLLIVWVVQGSDFFLYKVFAPRREAVRRKTFEQSKAYRQGMVQELQNMLFEYNQAAPEQQAALAAIILQRVADFDLNQLPPDLRAAVLRLRAARLTPGGNP